MSAPEPIQRDYTNCDTIIVGGNPAVKDEKEWEIWGDRTLTNAEKVARLNQLRPVPIDPALLTWDYSPQSLGQAINTQHPGKLLSFVELFDVPRRYGDKDMLSLFDPNFLGLPDDDPEKVRRTAFRSGDLPTLSALRSDIREGFYRTILGAQVGRLSSGGSTANLGLDDVLFMPIVRARRDLVRLWEGRKEGIPPLSGIDNELLRTCCSEVQEEGDMDGKFGKKYAVPCVGALTAMYWFLHDLGKRRQKEMGLDPKRRVLIRGFWEVDDERVREEDIHSAAQLAINFLGVDLVENTIIRTETNTYGDCLRAKPGSVHRGFVAGRGVGRGVGRVA